MIKTDLIKKEVINAGLFNFVLNGVFASALNFHFTPVSQNSAATDAFITVFLIIVLVSGFSFLSLKRKPNFREKFIIFILAISCCTFAFIFVKFGLPNLLFPLMFKYFVITKMLWTAALGSFISFCVNIYLLKN